MSIDAEVETIDALSARAIFRAALKSARDAIGGADVLLKVALVAGMSLPAAEAVAQTYHYTPMLQQPWQQNGAAAPMSPGEVAARVLATTSAAMGVGNGFGNQNNPNAAVAAAIGAGAVLLDQASRRSVASQQSQANQQRDVYLFNVHHQYLRDRAAAMAMGQNPGSVPVPYELQALSRRALLTPPSHPQGYAAYVDSERRGAQQQQIPQLPIPTMYGAIQGAAQSASAQANALSIHIGRMLPPVLPPSGHRQSNTGQGEY